MKEKKEGERIEGKGKDVRGENGQGKR